MVEVVALLGIWEWTYKLALANKSTEALSIVITSASTYNLSCTNRNHFWNKLQKNTILISSTSLGY